MYHAAIGRLGLLAVPPQPLLEVVLLSGEPATLAAGIGMRLVYGHDATLHQNFDMCCSTTILRTF
ncbi:hypothetical protein ASG12_04375 [Williamsia sp. Leaf354]|nr:hypothetical protein ASG12_04375 [Williamsia sp. Leaf354]